MRVDESKARWRQHAGYLVPAPDEVKRPLILGARIAEDVPSAWGKLTFGQQTALAFKLAKLGDLAGLNGGPTFTFLGTISSDFAAAIDAGGSFVDAISLIADLKKGVFNWTADKAGDYWAPTARQVYEAWKAYEPRVRESLLKGLPDNQADALARISMTRVAAANLAAAGVRIPASNPLALLGTPGTARAVWARSQGLSVEDVEETANLISPADAPPPIVAAEKESPFFPLAKLALAGLFGYGFLRLIFRK